MCIIIHLPAARAWQEDISTQGVAISRYTAIGVRRLNGPVLFVGSPHIFVPPSERQAVTVTLNKLKPADRQAVLNEAAARCAAGRVRKPSAYLMGLIQRALKGDFRPWAGQAESLPIAEPPPAPPRQLRKKGEPASALAQACLDELRQLRSKRSGHQ